MNLKKYRNDQCNATIRRLGLCEKLETLSSSSTASIEIEYSF